MAPSKRKTCHICGESTLALARHIKSKHTKIKDKLCPYEGCDRAFSNAGDLTNHINRIHKKLKPHACTWEGCGAKFFKRYERENHIKFVHLDIRDWVCVDLLDGVPCCEAFHTAGKLRRHLRETHSYDNTIPCSDCDEMFVSIDSRNKHIRYKHLNILRHSCNKGNCDYACFDKSDMKKHKEICTGGEHGSYGEVMVKNVLKKLKVKFLHDKSYKLMGNYNSALRWDFIILTDDEPLFIEYDGRQHFKPSRFGSSVTMEEAKVKLLEQQRKDKLKDDFCINEGYLLLRIPYTEVKNIEPIVKKFIAEETIGYLPNPYE